MHYYNQRSSCSNKRFLLQFCAALLLLLLTGSISTASAASRGITMEPVEQRVQTPFTKGTYRALIIGNNEYNDSEGKWLPLKTAVSDARAVEKLLKENYGFSDVRLLENSTRKEVIVALQKLSGDVASNDNVLVYYAGHGFLDEETKRGYWVPVDAKGVDKTTFLRNSTIRDELVTIADRSKHTLLISDSCFSGTLLRSGNRGPAPDTNSTQYYEKVANKKSVQIFAAGGVEYVDDDYKSSGHSPFTYFLLSELKNNDQPLLTISELSTNVEKAVANNVDQIPEKGVLQGAGDELGEFIFIKVNVAVDGIPKEKVKVQVNIVEKEKEEPEVSYKSDYSINVGVKLLASGWEGTTNGATDIEATSGSASQISMILHKGNFYTGFSLQSGEYTFDNKAPNQAADTGSQSFSNVKVVHSDIDIVAGYYFWEHVSLFIDVKAISNKWNNNDHESSFGGMGIGVSSKFPINERWDFLGHFSLMPSGDIEVDSKVMGEASSSELEVGAVYKYNSNNHFGIGLNLNSQEYEYGSGEQEEHNFTSLFVSYNYIFEFKE